jgi:hypothetical protein
LECLFCKQPSQTAQFQGLAGQIPEISTKLSTEILDFLQILHEINHLQVKVKNILRSAAGG